MRAPRFPALLLLVAAAASSATGQPPGAIPESEPDGFTTPAPQPLGALGAGGLAVAGTLDPTSPTGLDPGDRDGFSFTMEADGPLTATVDDGGTGTTLLLALAREDIDGAVLLAAVLGPSPLAISRPDLTAGPVYRVGVAALGDGNPLPYSLALSAADTLPPWTGALCDESVQEAEPDDGITQAVDFGAYDRILCGEGGISEVSPPDSGIPGDEDTFRFRNLLPVAARIAVTADPGLIHVELLQIGFVGPIPIVDVKFGEAGEMTSPPLEPGADYFLRFSAEQGTAPVHYDFHVEPTALPDPPDPEPLDLFRTVLRLAPDAKRSSFTVRARLDPAVVAGVEEGSPFSYRVRGLAESFSKGYLVEDSNGRFRFRGQKGTAGLHSLKFDPVKGVLVLAGRGESLAGSVDPADPTVKVLATLGTLNLAATEPGVFSRKGRVLKVR